MDEEPDYNYEGIIASLEAERGKYGPFAYSLMSQAALALRALLEKEKKP